MILQSHGRLADYSSALHRHKLALLMPTLGLAAATEVALRELPGIYESKASLTVRGVDASDVAGRLHEFRQRVTSRESLEPVIRKHNLQAGPLEATISQMRKRIFIEPAVGQLSRTEAFNVSFRASDPETARMVTDELAELLAAHRSNESPLSNSMAAVLRKRAAEISTELRGLEANNPSLVVLRPDLSAGTPARPSRFSALSSDAMRAQQLSVEGVKDQQYKIQQQLAELGRRIITQRQIVEQQPKGSNLRDDPTYAVLIAKRTELQGQRDTLINRPELTEKHPRVLTINYKIVAINHEIKELRRQDSALIVQSAKARELAALESERNRLKIELEVAGRELARRAITAPVQTAAPAPISGRRAGVGSKLALEECFSPPRRYGRGSRELVQDGYQAVECRWGDLPGNVSITGRPLAWSAPRFIAVRVHATYISRQDRRRADVSQLRRRKKNDKGSLYD